MQAEDAEHNNSSKPINIFVEEYLEHTVNSSNESELYAPTVHVNWQQHGHR
jgi:hypothetical protein